MATAAGIKKKMCVAENISQKTVKTAVPNIAINVMLATFGKPHSGFRLIINRTVSTSSEKMVEMAAPTTPRMGIRTRFPITFNDAANH